VCGCKDREIMKVRAVGPFFTARREAIQRYTREGLFESCDSSGAGRPGNTLHARLDFRGDSAVVVNCDAHAVVVVLDLAAYAIGGGRYNETPPETGKIVDGGRVHASIPREKQSGCERSTPGGADGDPRLTRNLTGAAVAAQLYHRLMSEAEAVQSAGTDLPAKGVERQLAIERYPFATLDEASTFAHIAEPECFQPGQGLKAETVI
jgi:hypothetical protein